MSNAIFSQPCASDVGPVYTPTVSGGSWLVGLPLSNVQSRDMSLVARSTDATPESTRLTVDLGADKPIRVIAIPKHTVSVAGKWRVTGVPSSMLFAYTAGDDIAAMGGVFTRATTATYVDENGLIRIAAIDVPRDGHFIDGERHTLLEGASTNHLLWSADANNAAWAKTTVTVGTGIADPFGGFNAQTLTSTAGGAKFLQTLANSSSVVRVNSVWLRRRTGAGAVNLWSPDTGTANTPTLTGTWTRYYVAGAASVARDFLIEITGNANAIDFYQGQMEDAPVPSSIIPTTTTTVTRAADSLSFPFTAVPQAMTVYCDQMELQAPASGGRVWQISSLAGASPNMGMTRSGAAHTIFHHNGSAQVDASTAVGSAFGDRVETRAVLYATGAVLVGRSLDSAVESVSAASAVNTLAAAWSAPTYITLNDTGAANSIGFAAFQSLRIASGVQTMVYMRASVHDSGWLDVAPVGATDEDLANLNWTIAHILSADVTARYWSVQILDRDNPAGYIDIARLWVAPGFQPTTNLSYGSQFGLETSSTRVETDGGSFVFNERPIRRTFKGSLDDQSDAEAIGEFLEMQRRLSTSGQLFFIYDPADVYLYRRAFLCTMRELSVMEFPYTNRASCPFTLIEEL